MIKTIPTLCGSVAGNPSQLGVKLHNAAYAATKQDFTYVAMGADQIEEVFDIAKLMGFRGLGVSMPFKESVIPLLDGVGDDVRAIGACNTVIFDEGSTTGRNTDWVGAQRAIDEVWANPISAATIIGAGGVARAIAYALRERGTDVFILARRLEQAELICSELGLQGAAQLSGDSIVNGELLVNATPVSTTDGPVSHSMLTGVEVFFDVAFSSRTNPLTELAQSLGVAVVPGWRMLLHQAAVQFELYTGNDAPVTAMSSVLETALPA